jgi:hypothetical protein
MHVRTFEPLPREAEVEKGLIPWNAFGLSRILGGGMVGTRAIDKTGELAIAQHL